MRNSYVPANLFHSMLKLEDIYDVVIAKDGQEAFDKVKESMSKGEFFDLIFMDVQVSLQPTLHLRTATD